MQTILILRESDIYPDTTDAGSDSFLHREAARAVVVDQQGKIALLNVSKHGYHKLPGGGIETGEDIQRALQRELIEEIGCAAKVTGEIGKIVEFRDKWSMKQTSYCFTALKVGTQKPPAFTEEELNDGFEMQWASSIGEAIILLENDKPTGYDGSFIQKRDLAFLRAAKAQL